MQHAVEESNLNSEGQLNLILASSHARFRKYLLTYSSVEQLQNCPSAIARLVRNMGVRVYDFESLI